MKQTSHERFSHRAQIEKRRMVIPYRNIVMYNILLHEVDNIIW